MPQTIRFLLKKVSNRSFDTVIDYQYISKEKQSIRNTKEKVLEDLKAMFCSLEQGDSRKEYSVPVTLELFSASLFMKSIIRSHIACRSFVICCKLSAGISRVLGRCLQLVSTLETLQVRLVAIECFFGMCIVQYVLLRKKIFNLDVQSFSGATFETGREFKVLFYVLRRGLQRQKIKIVDNEDRWCKELQKRRDLF